MKKNILFISDSSLNNPILHSQGLPYLSQLDESKFGVYFLSFEDPGNKEYNEIQFEEIKGRFNSNIRFTQAVIKKEGVFPRWFNFMLRSVRITAKIVKQHQIKLIHSRSFLPALNATLIKYFYKPSLKIIYDNRGLYIDEHIYNGRIKKNSLKEKIFRWLEEVIFKKCDAVVVVSNHFRAHLLGQGKTFRRIKEKIEVIPNRTQIYLKENEILERKTTAGEKVECVYSGSLADWQGTQLFYEMFESLTKVIPNISFKVLSYEKHLLPRFPEHLTEMTERIRVLSVPQYEVLEELINSHFGLILRVPILISRVSAPIKFAEYLAAGLPVLVNEGIGDSEEIISKYGVGVIIKNNDFENAVREMNNLLQDRDICSRCIQAAKEEFDIEISYKQYERIYNSLLS